MRFFISLICTTLLYCIFATTSRADTVLVVESYNSDFSWDASYLKGIADVLGDAHEIRTFALDTKRLPADQFEARAREAMEYFQQCQPALVILGDDNANRLLAPHLLKTGVPLVYLGLNNNPREYGLYGHPHVAGVMERPLLLQSLHIARRIAPFSVRKVLFLFDRSTTSDLIGREVFHGASFLELAGVRAEWLQVDTFADWADAVLGARKAGYDIVVLGLCQRLMDTCGKCREGDTVIRWTARNLSVPALGLWRFNIGQGKGGAAGLAHLGEQQGRIAGEIALRLLRGERSVLIPEKAEEGAFVFSRAEVARQGFVIPPELEGSAVIVE